MLITVPACFEILLLAPCHQVWVTRIRYVIFDEVGLGLFLWAGFLVESVLHQKMFAASGGVVVCVEFLLGGGDTGFSLNHRFPVLA